MMQKLLINFCFILSFYNTLNGQELLEKATIFFTDSTVLHGNFLFNSTLADTVYIEDNSGVKTEYPISLISEVLNTSRILKRIEYEDKSQLLEAIVIGKISLYRTFINDNNYLYARKDTQIFRLDEKNDLYINYLKFLVIDDEKLFKQADYLNCNEKSITRFVLEYNQDEVNFIKGSNTSKKKKEPESTKVYKESMFNQNPKFGKISISDLQVNHCPIDKKASAYYVFDHGNSFFVYPDTSLVLNETRNIGKGFQLIYKRHFRIKITGKRGIQQSKIEIPLYMNSNDVEQLSGVRGITYNLNSNNRITKEKLDKNTIREVQINENWKKAIFIMPNVQVGSIIEIEYTISSYFYFNLREWFFQYNIPTLKSEYHVTVPEYFVYNELEKGYYPIHRELEEKEKQLNINFSKKTRVGGAVHNDVYVKSYYYKDKMIRYYADSIQAFDQLQFLRSKNNYISKLEFELQLTKIPGRSTKRYTTDWQTINANLISSQKFIGNIDENLHLDGKVDVLKDFNYDSLELLKKSFNLIQKEMEWDGISTKYTSGNLENSFKAGIGNSADINLNLLLLIQKLGFDAYPVILSTQRNGQIHPASPSTSQFNYVIAVVFLNNKLYVLDATSKLSDINTLPNRCLNGKGWLVDNEKGGG